MRDTRLSQNRPYAVKAVIPNMLLFLYSMIPAMTWAMPPKNSPMDSIMLPRGNRPELCRFNNTVVIPNAINPSVAGLANFVSLNFFPP